MSDNNTIGGRIKYRRLELGLSQEKIAEALNADQATISKYENDTRPVPSDILGNLSRILKTTPTYLIFGGPEDDEFISELISIAGRIECSEIKKTVLEQMESMARLDEIQREYSKLE